MTSQKPRDRPCGIFGEPPNSARCNELTDMVVQADERWGGMNNTVPVCPAHAAQAVAAFKTLGASVRLLQWTLRQVPRWGLVELDPAGYRGAACWPPADKSLSLADAIFEKTGLAETEIRVTKQDYYDPGGKS
jgi:hypothetical protein